MGSEILRGEGGIVVEAATTGGALDRFLELPEHVYRGDPNYCPPFREAVTTSLLRPDFADHQRILVALDDGRPVARVVARLSPTLRDDAGRPVALLGFFESLENPPAVEKLFREAVGWLRSSGAGTIVGPLDGDTWHGYRLNIGPHDEPPFLMEPYNPGFYPRLWEANGFRVRERYYSKRVDDLAGVIDALEPRFRAVLEAGYRLQSLQLDRFREELSRLHALSCEIFRDNFLYTEISEERFVELYGGAQRLIDPDLVWFAVAPDGTDAGFLFAVPDRARAVAAMRGRKGALSALRFLALRGRTDAVNLKSLGVVRAHRRSGLATALMCLGYRTARDKGYARANLCLILDGNPSGDLDAGLGRLLRRYHLYRLAEDSGA